MKVHEHKFMKRTYDPNTDTYRFADGSSPITSKQKERILWVNETMGFFCAFVLKEQFVKDNKKV